MNNNNKVSGASVLKTIIAFRNGTILRHMSERKAAANAMLCFHLLPQVRQQAKITPLPSSITESGAYDVMQYHSFELEKLDLIDEPVKYADNLPMEEIHTINAACTALSEMLIDSDELPVVGGKNAVDRIYQAIVKDGTH